MHAPRDEHTLVLLRVVTDYRLEFFGDLRERSDRRITVIHGPLEQSAAQGISVQESRDNVRKLERRFDLPFGLVHLRGSLRVLRQERPTTVVVEANPRFITVALVLTYCRIVGLPALIWGLGTTPQVSGVKRQVERAFGLFVLAVYARLACGAIAYGEQAATTYRRLGGGSLNVRVAPNSTRPQEPRMRLSSARVATASNFLFVGRLVPQKRVDLLLEAWSRVEGSGLAASLTIAGDGPVRLDLEAQAARLGLRHVRFVGGVRRDRLIDLFARHAWFVMPGAGGLAAKEALAAGLPLIGFRRMTGDGTLSDVIHNGHNSLLAEQHSADGLAVLIVDAVKMSAAHRIQMSEAAATVQRDAYDEMLVAFAASLEEAECRQHSHSQR